MPEAWTGRLIGQMHNNKVTRQDIATELGVSRQYVTMILNGQRKGKDTRSKVESAYERIISRKKQ